MRGRISEDRDAACFQSAIDAMKDLSLFTLPQKKEIKLTMDSMSRLILPEDYMMFIALGVPKDGRLLTFTRDSLIVQTSDKTYSYEAYDTTYGEGQDIPLTSSFSYGSPGGSNDVYFVINERERYIQLANFTGTKATLVYVSTGIDQDPELVTVPLVAQEAIIAYILWMEVQYDVRISPVVARERERLYGEALLDIKNIHSPTANEILDTFYSTFYSTIKRM
jgi:hypothetical protein